MVQHPLTEIPSLCMDMTGETVVDARIEHRKTLEEVRYVKPLMLLCPSVTVDAGHEQSAESNCPGIVGAMTDRKTEEIYNA